MAETQAPAVVTEKPTELVFDMGLSKDVRATERIEMQRATAMVYAANQRAIQFPRDEDKCVEKILKACTNVKFAADALYKVPRGNQIAEGLSVKALREFARLWGNLHTGVIAHGRYSNMSQFAVIAIDLESNYIHENEYTVEHARWISDNKRAEGGYMKPVYDPQSVGEICKAVNSKERRNAIGAVLPYWLEEQAIQTVKRTLYQEVKDVKAAWDGCKTQFAKWGVQPASLMRYVNKTLAQVDKLDAADIVELRLIKDAIKENGAVADVVFPERDKTKAAPAAKEESSTAQTAAATTKPTSNDSQNSTSKTEEKSPSSSTTTSKPSSTPSGKQEPSAAGETKPPESQSQTAKSTATQKPAASAPKESAKPKSSSAQTQSSSSTTNTTSSAQNANENSKDLPTTQEPETPSTSESTQSTEDTTPEAQSSTDTDQTDNQQTDFNPTDESDESETQSSEEDGEEPPTEESEEQHDPEDEVQPGDTF